MASRWFLPAAVMALVVGVPGAVGDFGWMAGHGALTAERLVAVLGHEPASVRVTSHGPGGASVRDMAWDDFAAALAATSLGNAPGADGPVPGSRCSAAGVAGVPCGPDFSAGNTLNTGPFCDGGGAWILYAGAPPGSSYVQHDVVGPPVGICGGFFGAAPVADITMTNTLVPEVLQGLVWEGCYAQTWTFHSNGYCPNPFTPLDSFVVAFQGRGFGLSVEMDGLSLDYFLSNGSPAAYDLGGCVPDVACVRWAV